MKTALFLSLLTGFAVNRVWAQVDGLPMSVNSTVSGESVTAAPASGLVTRSNHPKINLKINNTCFATNLRSIKNPLAANSTIKANLELKIGSKNYKISVDYPAGIVGGGGAQGVVKKNPKTSSVPTGTTSVIYGNSVILQTPFETKISVGNDGVITESDKGMVRLTKAEFTQDVNTCNETKAVYGSMGWSSYTPTFACGNYMGKDGPISASIGGISVSSDRSNIELNVAFPGETGFCGGYWSPLMVFFDDQRPKFMNISNFPLNPFGKTFWPEKDHTGFFVAIDRDQSGKIDQKNELFGDNGQVANGFEVLKEFDSNHDGLINKRDKDFAKLLLWQDINGDGVSQAEELKKLSDRLVKISLKYKNDSVVPLGAYAEERQRSKFWYKNAQGHLKKGDIIDIWLAPVLETTVSQHDSN